MVNWVLLPQQKPLYAHAIFYVVETSCLLLLRHNHFSNYPINVKLKSTFCTNTIGCPFALA